MRIDPQIWAKPPAYAIRKLVELLNGLLDFENNVQQKTILVATPALIGVEFPILHGLGKIPQRYIANPESEAVVWSSNKSNWTESTMYLRSSAANVLVTLTVW